MASATPHRDGFYGALAEMAEELRYAIIALIDEERLDYLQRRVTESEIVFGVWPDPNEKGGFGFHLIKGRGHLAALSGVKLPDELTTTAIPCVGLDQAIAAEQVWGALDPDQSRLKTVPQKKRQKAKPRPKEKRTTSKSTAAPKKARRTRH